MRALIVEDEEQLAVTLKKSFEEELFVVDIAKDGKEGSYMARTNNYDLIILDNMLPYKNGLEVCTDIRKENRETPILVLSVKPEVTTKVELLNAGADDYMIKPFSFEELLARARALMRRPTGGRGDILKMGDMVLDKKRHIVKNKERELSLTKKEFMLLQYFMMNPGIVLSRGMIMEHVWDMSADPFSNTIEAHVRSLRKKLGNSGLLIRTILGRGYKMSEE